MFKKMFVMVLTVLYVMSMLTSCKATTNVYEPANTDIRLKDRLFSSEIVYEEPTYEDELMELYGISVLECLQMPYTSEEIEKYTTLLGAFFEEVYDIDLSKELQKIKTYLAPLPTTDTLGFNFSDTHEVFINQILVENLPNNVKFTWCHEVIHALGMHHRSDLYEDLYETITEALTCQFFEWCGNKTIDNSSYTKTATTVGYQLIIVDPSIVSEALVDDSFRVEEKINNVLEDATYPFGKLPEDTTIAFQLASYLNSIHEVDFYYQNNPLEFEFTVQEIVAAYCREFNPDKETMKILQKHWILEDFDKLDLVYSDNIYYIK